MFFQALNKMRIYAIGDIHGCVRELTFLHEKIFTNDKFKIKDDLIISEGAHEQYEIKTSHRSNH